MSVRTTLSVVVLSCLISPAFAQSSSPSSSMGTSTADRTATTDRHSESLTSEEFVKKAAMANLAEVEASQVAIDKAQDPAVKTFAQQMIQDHTKAADNLKTLSNSKGWSVPSEADAMHKAELMKLKALSGAAFDKAYTEQMRKDHAKAVELFSTASSASQVDPDLRQFAKQTLPTLQHHKQLALQDLPKSGG